MPPVACTLGVGLSAASVSGVAEHGHFVRDVGAGSPGLVRDAADGELGSARRCDILPAMRRCNSGTAGPGESRRITCRPTSPASLCRCFWRSASRSPSP
jgi:hypothetical protein